MLNVNISHPNFVKFSPFAHFANNNNVWGHNSNWEVKLLPKGKEIFFLHAQNKKITNYFEKWGICKTEICVQTSYTKQTTKSCFGKLGLF
jgi:hypothetical protein